MSIPRTEEYVYYSIEASDEFIAGVCSRFHITPDSAAFRDALGLYSMLMKILGKRDSLSFLLVSYKK